MISVSLRLRADCSRRAESALCPLGLGKRVDQAQLGLHDGCDDYLGDPHAALQAESFFPSIEENDLDLAAIIAVDRSRRIEHGHAMFRGQSRTRANLRLVASRQFDAKAGRNQKAVARLQRPSTPPCRRGSGSRARSRAANQRSDGRPARPSRPAARVRLRRPRACSPDGPPRRPGVRR